MGDIDVGVGKMFWLDVVLKKKQDISFGLWYGLAPEVHGKSCGRSTEDTNKMVFPSLDGLLGYISAVLIGGK